MASSLSNLVNNVCEECVEYNVNTDMMIQKSTFVGIKYKYCDWFYEYANFKVDLIEYNCLCCNKSLMKS